MSNTQATKSRDSLKQVRADMVTKSDLETFGKSLVLEMAKLIPEGTKLLNMKKKEKK